MKQITWKVVRVAVSKIKPTPNNYKLKTEDGTARFNTSIKKFGLAGAVILNADYILIDGNTRWEKAKELKEKYIDASMPSRKLSPKEFTEFSAIYDMARAGEVDILRIKEELGTSKDFLKAWGLELPKDVQKKLADLEQADAAKSVSEKSSQGKKSETPVTLRQVALMFTSDDAEKFLNTAESIYKKFKVDNVTDLCMKLVLAAKKGK